MNPIGIKPNQLHRSQAAWSLKDFSSTSDRVNAALSDYTLSDRGSVLVTLDSKSRQHAMARSSADEQPASSKEGGLNDQDTVSQTVAATLSGSAVVEHAIAADTAGLEAVKAAMQNNLSDLAASPKAFHAAMVKSFGASYDKAQAEAIRQQVLDGDFSWMPEIAVVDESVLVDQSGQQGSGVASGAYSKDNDTIYISRQLLSSDPDKAIQILTEEVGHGLDARLNTSDAAGDEGDIFSRLVSGEEISDAQLAELKSENDSGTIVVDGKEVEVEYNFLKKGLKKLKKGVKKLAKSVGKAVKGAVNAVVEPFKQVWEGVKKIGKKILESKLIGQIMTIAQFIPIPVVQVVARGYNALKSGYMLAKGIQHGSLAMVLGGAAGVAGGIGSIGKALGASQGFVAGANRIAGGLSKAGMAYKIASEKDFAAAAEFASNYFGGPETGTGRAFQAAAHAINTADKIKDGDYLGAISSGTAAYRGLNSDGNAETESTSNGNSDNPASRTGSSRQASRFSQFIDNISGSKTYTAIVENVSTFRNIVKLVKTEGLSAGSQAFLTNYGDDLGIGTDVHQDIIKWAGVLDKVKATADQVKNNDYANAIGEAAGLLGIPLSTTNQQRLETVFQLRDSVLGDKYADASRHAAVLSMQTGNPELAANFIQLANLLEGKPRSTEQRAA